MPSVYNSSAKQNYPKEEGLNFDLITRIIALGLVLGVAFFYFGSLQPLILNRYTNNLETQIGLLQSKLVSQTQNFTDSKLAITQKITSFNPIEICSTSQLIDTNDQDFSNIEEFKLSLLPDSDLSSPPRYLNFYLKESEIVYSRLYDEYQNILAEYSRVYEQGIDLKALLEYRNFWIENCEQIENSKGQIDELKELCQNQDTVHRDFVSRQIYSEIYKNVAQSQSRCAEVINYNPSNTRRTTYPNFDQWFLDWYEGFQSLMTYNTDFIPGINDLPLYNQNFSLFLDEAYRDIENIESSKDRFLNQFYLMDF
ncbi:MAG: hypothetical protein AAGF07_00430 [Patescibacteria group bacterium]